MIDGACMGAVLAFFTAMHMPLRQVPSVAFDNSIQHSGFYRDGLILLKSPTDNCGVLAHEMYHHYQAERGVRVDRFKAEEDAKHFEDLFNSQ